MRQTQNRNRSRGRGRRPANAGNRVYESNGPDVKVRGTAQTVADKYLQLGRDAVSAGDSVKAEGYFQHAEHYLRIIAAAQEQIQARRQQQQEQREQRQRDKTNGRQRRDDAAASDATAGETPGAASADPDPAWGGPQPGFLAAPAASADPEAAASDGDGRDRRAAKPDDDTAA